MASNQDTIKVAGPNGAELQAKQLATFTTYIKGVQFRFIVTRLDSSNIAAITHRSTRMKVCDVPTHTAISSAGDWIAAGRRALEDFIKRIGEDRIYTVLSAAEKRA